MSDNPTELNAHGMAALNGGDAAEARRCFAAAAALDPKAPQLWMNLAAAERALGDDAGERVALDKAIAIDVRNFMAQLRLAELQERRGELADATATWQRVLVLAPALGEIPPALADRLEEARAFVNGRMEGLAASLDAELGSDIAVAGETDRRRFQACLDLALGRRRHYVNECAGVHYPFLPADEYFDRDLFPWIAALEAKTDVIRAEFLALHAKGAEAIRPYVRQEEGTPDNKWSPLNNSLDWGACFLWEYGVRNDPVCELCPETAAILESIPRANIPGRSPSAFFSLLKPGKRIPPHTGVTNTRAIVHLPLIVPEGCAFRVGGETRPWREGEAFAFDDTIEHEAWNTSDQLRVLLIFDIWNPHLSTVEQDLLCRFFATADASGSMAVRE